MSIEEETIRDSSTGKVIAIGFVYLCEGIAIAFVLLGMGGCFMLMGM